MDNSEEGTSRCGAPGRVPKPFLFAEPISLRLRHGVPLALVQAWSWGGTGVRGPRKVSRDGSPQLGLNDGVWCARLSVPTQQHHGALRLSVCKLTPTPKCNQLHKGRTGSHWSHPAPLPVDSLLRPSPLSSLSTAPPLPVHSHKHTPGQVPPVFNKCPTDVLFLFQDPRQAPTPPRVAGSPLTSTLRLSPVHPSVVAVTPWKGEPWRLSLQGGLSDIVSWVTHVGRSSTAIIMVLLSASGRSGGM